MSNVVNQIREWHRAAQPGRNVLMSAADYNDDLIYLWPDGTWCRKEDLEEYLSFMSDDFEVRQALAYDEHGNPCHTERLPRRTLTC